MKKYCSVIRVIIQTQVDQKRSGVGTTACQTMLIHRVSAFVAPLWGLAPLLQMCFQQQSFPPGHMLDVKC